MANLSFFTGFNGIDTSTLDLRFNGGSGNAAVGATGRFGQGCQLGDSGFLTYVYGATFGHTAIEIGFKITAWTGEEVLLFSADDSDFKNASVTYDESIHSIKVYTADGATLLHTFPTDAVPHDIWFTLGLYCLIGDSNGEIICRLWGPNNLLIDEYAAGSLDTKGGVSDGNPRYATVMDNSTAGCNATIDCMYTADNGTFVDPQLFGPVTIYGVFPVADGESIEFAPSAPTVPLVDDFHRANGPLGAAWTNDPFGSGGTFVIDTNVAKPDGLGAGGLDTAKYNTTYTSSYEVFMKLSVLGTDPLGSINLLMINGGFSGYGLTYQPSIDTISIATLTAGVPGSPIATVVQVLSANDSIGLRRINATDVIELWAIINNEKILLFAGTDSTHHLTVNPVIIASNLPTVRIAGLTAGDIPAAEANASKITDDNAPDGDITFNYVDDTNARDLFTITPFTSTSPVLWGSQMRVMARIMNTDPSRTIRPLRKDGATIIRSGTGHTLLETYSEVLCDEQFDGTDFPTIQDFEDYVNGFQLGYEMVS